MGRAIFRYHYLMRCVIGPFFLAFVVTSCAPATFSKYQNIDPTKLATISFVKSGQVSIQDIEIDGERLSWSEDGAKLPVGDYTFKLSYQWTERAEDADTDGSYRHDMYSSIHYGRCKGSISVREPAPYLVTIELRDRYVVGRVSAKGYFEFSEREKEPTPGNVSCQEL